MSAKAEPLGGPIFTRTFLVLAAFTAVGFGLMAVRYLTGLSTITNLSDGYSWGIWKPLNVVIATSIGAGGYGMAILVYVLNKGRYHDLVRPALLTSALAYTIGGTSVMVDLGRWWAVWQLPFVWLWNGNSILLEVSICVISYLLVLWVEVSQAMLEGLQTSPKLGRYARWLQPKLETALPFLIALGVLLPTMHQSSLGGLYLLSSILHPLWHTSLLPLLFLITCLMMGYSGVVIQDALTRMILHRPQENDILPRLSKIVVGIAAVYLAIRFGDLVYKGRVGLLFEAGRFAPLFWIEVLLAVAGALLLLRKAGRESPGVRFGAALLFVFSGALYRFDTYLVALQPVSGWHYWPSIGETFLSLGLFSMAGCIFIIVVKRFPVLSAAHPSHVS